MSDEYDEPAKRRTFPLYMAGSIIGTMPVLSAMRSMFGMDLVGGIIDTITFIPDRISEDRNVIGESFDYLTGLARRGFAPNITVAVRKISLQT